MTALFQSPTLKNWNVSFGALVRDEDFITEENQNVETLSIKSALQKSLTLNDRSRVNFSASFDGLLQSFIFVGSS